MSGKLLKIAEFADLCLTTKDTLLHYDHKGLLKPRRVLSNGYRFYSPEQFYEFDFINLLKDAGKSISEIREILSRGEVNLPLFSECWESLVRQKLHLERRIRMLEHLIDLGNEAGNIELRTVVLQKRSLPQQFVRFSVDPMIDALDAKQTSRATSRLMHAQRSCGLEIAPPVGAVLDLDEALGGRHRIKTYLFEADMLEGQDAENFTLQTMPAGEYAEMIAAGTVGDHQSALLELFQDLRQKGLAAAGDIYLFDELSYLTHANRDYSVRYAVSVKKAV